MKTVKAILGGLIFVLIIVYLSFARLRPDMGYSDAVVLLTSLSTLFAVFALVSIPVAIVLGYFAHLNKVLKVICKVFSIVAVITTIATGGVGLPCAICSIRFTHGLAIANVAISGTIILFSLIFVPFALSSPTGEKKEAEAEGSSVTSSITGGVALELNTSKEVEKSAQISAVSNVGVGLWTNICFSLCQIFGKKSEAYQKKMNKIKADALEQLLGQAKGMGADTVTDIHYALSGLTVVASGTAVFYKK